MSELLKIGEAFTGEDAVTGEALSWKDRLLGIIPYYKVGKKASVVLDATKKITKTQVKVIKAAVVVKKIEDKVSTDPTKNRVKLRKSVVEDIKKNQERNAEGEMIDPYSKKVLDPEKTDIGHKKGEEWWRRILTYKEKGSTRKEVVEAENDASLYQLEDRKGNRSHVNEKKD